jgi:hypothetical protein
MLAHLNISSLEIALDAASVATTPPFHEFVDDRLRVGNVNF